MRVTNQFTLKIFSFICLLIVTFCGYAESDSTSSAKMETTSSTLPSPLVSKPDPNELFLKHSINQFLRDNHIPGIALAVIINGKSYAYYAGYADIAKQVPVSERTIFDIGSLSKIMTNILFTQEVDFAKMNLDDSLRKYLPELSKTFDHITLQELATHTGSLPFNIPHSVKERNELNAYLAKWSPNYTPGKTWIYSNVGIGLLGYAVEGSTLRNLDDLYWRHILFPLGMRKIGTVLSDEQQLDYASGYDKNNQPVRPVDVGLFPGAYAFKMSADDMQRFLSAAVGLPGTPERVFYPLRMTQAAYLRLYNREQGLGWEIHTIKPSTINTLLHDTRDTDMGPLSVRETYERAKFDGNALIDKTGSTKGFHAYIAVIPNKQSGIAILVNKDIPNSVIMRAGREILFKMTHIA